MQLLQRHIRRCTAAQRGGHRRTSKKFDLELKPQGLFLWGVVRLQVSGSSCNFQASGFGYSSSSISRSRSRSSSSSSSISSPRHSSSSSSSSRRELASVRLNLQTSLLSPALNPKPKTVSSCVRRAGAPAQVAARQVQVLELGLTVGGFAI